MKFTVVHYGDPILRQRGARIESVDEALREKIAAMFDTMYRSHGIGLAAQQVGLALQLAVIDVRGMKASTSVLIKDRKSTRLNSSHSSVSRMPSSA